MAKADSLSLHHYELDPSVGPTRQKRFYSDGDLVFSRVRCTEFSPPVANTPEVTDISPSPYTEIRIIPEDCSPTRRMHPICAWYRRTMPSNITGHHVWHIIHALAVVSLIVLYFLRIIPITAGTIAICELLLGVLVRNEIFISVLHCLVAFVPCLTYELNRMVHCIGGLHVSSTVCAFLWLLISLAFEAHHLAVRITGSVILVFIITLSLTAMPIVRRRFHNTFERVHRYAGWTCLLVLVAHVVCLQLEKFSKFEPRALFNVPVIILVLIISIIFLPWLCVRKVSVQFHQPSKDLTVVTFPEALYPYGSITRVSFDGHEWHAFAIALTDPCSNQHSILVAAVGDWTKTLAENYRASKLPDEIWIRRIKGLGFMYSIHAYRKVLIVCTGSGIAPALPYVKDPLPTTHTHLLWIAKQHEQTYGEYIWDLVQKLTPHVTLHDTAIHGRPGAQLVEEYFYKTDAQAVFVVSNEKFTREVTNELWKKNIPCFGALFDS